MKDWDHDLIVVGAGPAGTITAAAVAEGGFDVLVLEKKPSCCSPCAGYISNTINLDMPAYSVVQSRIKNMRTYFPDMSFHDFQLNGFVVDRPSFDMSLAKKAMEAGARIKWSSPLIDIGGNRNVKFGDKKASTRIIVGADGVFSKTAKLLGMEQQKFASCFQYHMEGISILQGTCEIFFNSEFAPGGYVWVYPTGNDSAKVGIGITGRGSPHRYLDSFLNKSEAAQRLAGRITEYITGALPIGGLREKLVSGNILLVGDSAGMADPVTGAGINNAMLAGEIAGKTIIEALSNDDIELLPDYEVKIRKLLGKPLSRSLEKRKTMDACNNNELLQRLLPRIWVGLELARMGLEINMCDHGKTGNYDGTTVVEIARSGTIRLNDADMRTKVIESDLSSIDKYLNTF